MDDKCPQCGKPYRFRFKSVSPYEVMSLAERETKVRPHMPDSRECFVHQLAAAKADNARLQAIVDRLPRDNHGEPIVPNTPRYYVHPKGMVCEIQVVCNLAYEWWNYDSENVAHRRTLAEDSYSTREAAETTKEKGGRA